MKLPSCSLIFLSVSFVLVSERSKTIFRCNSCLHELVKLFKRWYRSDYWGELVGQAFNSIFQRTPKQLWSNGLCLASSCIRCCWRGRWPIARIVARCCHDPRWGSTGCWLLMTFGSLRCGLACFSGFRRDRSLPICCGSFVGFMPPFSSLKYYQIRVLTTISIIPTDHLGKENLEKSKADLESGEKPYFVYFQKK